MDFLMPHLNVNLAHDLQNILPQSYDNLTTMPMLRSTYDGRLIYKTLSTEYLLNNM